MAGGTQRKRLVRGLATFIDGFEADDAVAAEGQRTVALDALRPGRFNPRRNFPEAQLEELAASIRERGLVQPLVVRPVRGEHEAFEIVAGERRWRAAQRANLHEVPVVVRALSDQEAIEIAIIENVQREDLNAVEEAEGYRLLMDGHGYTQEDLAKVIGKSRSHLANTLRLLKLPDTVQQLLRTGELSAGHARALIGRADAAVLAARIVSEGLTVRQVEALVQDHGRAAGKARKPAAKDADTRAAESELKAALGLDIDIRCGRGEKGELRIRYATLDQLEEVRHRLLRHPSGARS
jgi:ParB family chromosome partitioning protein